jgi:Flp pilus assembly protein TadG
MRARRIRNTRKNEKGQSLVEFALVVPLLLLLVIGIFEFGRAWMTKNIMTGAAREGVRILAVPTGSTAAAWGRADNVLRSAGIATANINVYDAASYQPVSVTVTYNFPVLTGLIPGLDNITLRSTTTMRREY